MAPSSLLQRTDVCQGWGAVIQGDEPDGRGESGLDRGGIVTSLVRISFSFFSPECNGSDVNGFLCRKDSFGKLENVAVSFNTYFSETDRSSRPK